MSNTIVSSSAGRVRFFNLNIKQRQIIVDVIAAIFILLFFYTALHKSLDIRSTARVITKTTGLTTMADIIAWIVVGVEYMTSGLLLFSKTRRIGLITSLVSMIGFTLYIGYMLMLKSNLPCTCGGIISRLTWVQHLVLNCFLIALAFWGVNLSRHSDKYTKSN